MANTSIGKRFGACIGAACKAKSNIANNFAENERMALGYVFFTQFAPTDNPSVFKRMRLSLNNRRSRGAQNDVVCDMEKTAAGNNFKIAAQSTTRGTIHATAFLVGFFGKTSERFLGNSKPVLRGRRGGCEAST